MLFFSKNETHNILLRVIIMQQNDSLKCIPLFLLKFILQSTFSPFKIHWDTSQTLGIKFSLFFLIIFVLKVILKGQNVFLWCWRNYSQFCHFTKIIASKNIIAWNFQHYCWRSKGILPHDIIPKIIVEVKSEIKGLFSQQWEALICVCFLDCSVPNTYNTIWQRAAKQKFMPNPLPLILWWSVWQ